MRQIEEARKCLEEGNLARAQSLLQPLNGEAEASTLLGIILAKSNQLDQAAESLTFALSLEPHQTETLTWLALVRKSQNLPEQAIPLLAKVLEQRKDDPEIFNLFGICLLAVGRAAEAEKAFGTVMDLVGETAPAYSNLGMSLRLQNRGPEAVDAFRRSLELAPELPNSYLQLFKQFQQLSWWDEGLACLRLGLNRHPDSIPLLEALALSYGRLNRSYEAEEIFKKIAPLSPSAANSYATWLQEMGRFQDSVAVSRHSLKLQPIQGAPYRNIVESQRFNSEDRSIELGAQNLLKDPRLDMASRMHLNYALAKISDQQKEYRKAMQFFDAANEIAYRTYPACQAFDQDWTRREPDLIAKLFSREFIDQVQKMGCLDSRPIFIVGMIRSGTTLLDQIISSHPEVSSVGEQTFWNAQADSVHPRWAAQTPQAQDVDLLAHDYFKAVNDNWATQRFSDKMPLNYRNLGLIHGVFPNARILHIKRDPLDTCVSIYSTFFAGGPGFAYKQENIVKFYRAYRSFMNHWRLILPADRIFELDYEALVTDPEPLVRKIIDFLDLPWDDACLRHEQNNTQVSTPSRWQARQPIYTSSVGKSKQYKPFLGALAELA